MKWSYSTILLVLLWSALGCQTTQSSSTEDPVSEVLSVSAYAEAIKDRSKVQLVDVRTPAEYNQGTIEGSLHINFYDENFAQQLEAQLDKNKPVYIFCRSGNRSGKASVMMKEMGFKKVYDLAGGWLAWNGQKVY